MVFPGRSARRNRQRLLQMHCMCMLSNLRRTSQREFDGHLVTRTCLKLTSSKLAPAISPLTPPDVLARVDSWPTPALVCGSHPYRRLHPLQSTAIPCTQSDGIIWISSTSDTITKHTNKLHMNLCLHTSPVSTGKNCSTHTEKHHAPERKTSTSGFLPHPGPIKPIESWCQVLVSTQVGAAP